MPTIPTAGDRSNRTVILQGVILKLCADWTFEFPKPHALAPRMDAALALFLKGASAEEARGAHEKGRES